MARYAGLDLIEHRDRRADLTRRTIAALIAVMLDERLLHRVRPVRCPKALDRHDVVVVMLHRQAEAAVDPPSARDHRAGAALSVIAALFRAPHAQTFAQYVAECRVRNGVDRKSVLW